MLTLDRGYVYDGARLDLDALFRLHPIFDRASAMLTMLARPRAGGARDRAGRSLLPPLRLPVPRALRPRPRTPRTRHRRTAVARRRKPRRARSRRGRGDPRRSGGFPAYPPAARRPPGGVRRPPFAAWRRDARPGLARPACSNRCAAAIATPHSAARSRSRTCCRRSVPGWGLRRPRDRRRAGRGGALSERTRRPRSRRAPADFRRATRLLRPRHAGAGGAAQGADRARSVADRVFRVNAVRPRRLPHAPFAVEAGRFLQLALRPKEGSIPHPRATPLPASPGRS